MSYFRRALLGHLEGVPCCMMAVSIESLEQDGRHWPLSTVGVHPSIMIGQTGCSKAAAAIKIPLATFTQTPTHAFVRVDAGGGVEWFGRP